MTKHVRKIPVSKVGSRILVSGLGVLLSTTALTMPGLAQGTCTNTSGTSWTCTGDWSGGFVVGATDGAPDDDATIVIVDSLTTDVLGPFTFAIDPLTSATREMTIDLTGVELTSGSVASPIYVAAKRIFSGEDGNEVFLNITGNVTGTSTFSLAEPAITLRNAGADGDNGNSNTALGVSGRSGVDGGAAGAARLVFNEGGSSTSTISQPNAANGAVQIFTYAGKGGNGGSSSSADGGNGGAGGWYPCTKPRRWLGQCEPA
ncbi:MAG: hypothetical protein AAF724_00580 [Pseudomonadota bacterium]